MKNAYVVAVLVGVFLAGSVSVAVAQGQSQLVSITEIHVKPGMRAEFEAGRKRVVARWAENDLSFPAQMSVDEDGVYRQVAVTGGWEDFERRRQEFQAMSGSNPRAQGVVDHVRQSILRTRPELGYAPDNPRVPFGEVGFIRYVFFYLRPGTGAEAGEILQKLSALRERHSIRDGVIVTTAVVGYDAPMLLLRLHARDREDYYSQTQENRRIVGEEGAELRGQLAALARRIEVSNNVTRPDLAYQPSN